MAILVFMLPFDAEMHRPDAEQLARQLQLTLTRVDDWDREMGFRIVGATGAVRLYKRSGDEDTPVHDWYEFYGSAIEQEDYDPVRQLFGRCVEAVRSIGGRIQEFRVIDPDHSVELPAE